MSDDDDDDENDDDGDWVGDGDGGRDSGTSYIKTNKFKPMSNNNTQRVLKQLE